MIAMLAIGARTASIARRVHGDRDVRRPGLRMDRGERARKEASPAEREQDARGAQRVTGQIAEHRDAADREQERAAARAAFRQRVRERRL